MGKAVAGADTHYGQRNAEDKSNTDDEKLKQLQALFDMR